MNEWMNEWIYRVSVLTDNRKHTPIRIIWEGSIHKWAYSCVWAVGGTRGIVQEPRLMERHCHTPRLERMRGERLLELGGNQIRSLPPSYRLSNLLGSPAVTTRLPRAHLQIPATNSWGPASLQALPQTLWNEEYHPHFAEETEWD